MQSAHPYLVTILLVEDDFRHARLIERLRRRACTTNEIITIHDGQEAVDCLLGEHAHAEAYDALPFLALLDLDLPGLDGVQVLARLRADERTRDIPVF